jgi:hypothetical protein
MIDTVPLPNVIHTLARRRKTMKRKKKLMPPMSPLTWKPLLSKSTKKKKKLRVLPAVRTPKLWLKKIDISERKRKSEED